MEQDKKGNQKKKRLSKRAILYLVNGLFFVGMTAFLFMPATVHRLGNSTIAALILILAQGLFTFFSLFIYYFSIIADAMSKRYQNRTEDENKPKTK